MEKRTKKRRKRRLRPRFGWRLALLAIIPFFVYNIFVSIRLISVRTEVVELGQILNAAEKKAVIIRDEEVISSPYEGFVEYIVSQGDRIRKGTDVAVIKSGYDTEDLHERLRLIDYKIQNYSGEDTSANIEAEINKKNLELQVLYADLQKRILAEEEEYLPSLKEEILKVNEEKKFLRETGRGGQKSLEELKNEKQMILSQLKGTSYRIKTPKSGVIVAYCDGYEGIFTFDNRNKLTVSEIEKVSDKNKVDLKKSVSKDDPIGKTVYNFKYYFACQVDKEDIEHIRSFQPVRIYVDSHELTGYLEDFHKGGDGKFLGLFCVEDETFRFYENRSYKIRVEYDNEKGLKIPRSALVKNSEGEEGVYVVDEAGTANFKKLSPILTQDDKYIVCRYRFGEEKQEEEIDLYDEIVVNPSGVYQGQRVK
ncbi:MAG: HlyD family efflux transporter periplasmic adaptor subunit [Filifactor alocis]|nr:HlyD family efflux transporter periplasmic adaptor subunit [Filifactor alocis]